VSNKIPEPKTYWWLSGCPKNFSFKFSQDHDGKIEAQEKNIGKQECSSAEN